MRLRSKVILAIIPIVGAALILTSWLVINNATRSSHDAIYRYSEGILDAYITQDLVTRVNLLRKNKLDNIPSFVSRYQKEALAAASELNLIWPGHLFIVKGEKDIVYCSTDEISTHLPPLWENLRREVAVATGPVTKGHIGDEGRESYVARYFHPWDWTVVISIHEDFLHEKEKEIWYTVAFIGVFTFLALLVCLGLTLNKLVIQPVMLLRKTTGQIAEDDAPVSISIRDGDELGELSRDIENMSLRIHESRKALREAYESLLRLDDMKTTLITTVSHELRTPLTSILGFAKLGLKKTSKCQFDPKLSIEENMAKQDTAIRESLTIISEQSNSMSAMIDNIVLLMSLISKTSPTDMRHLDIVPIVRRVCQELEGSAAAKGLSLLTFVPERSVPVQADSKMLETVLDHFITNAIEFTNEGCIEVLVTKTDGNAQVEVRDTGIGMSKECTTKIFDEFYQSGDIMTEKPKGLGVGLSICRKIVELHGGQTWAESTPDKGSSFYFTLPLTKSTS